MKKELCLEWNGTIRRFVPRINDHALVVQLTREALGYKKAAGSFKMEDYDAVLAKASEYGFHFCVTDSPFNKVIVNADGHWVKRLGQWHVYAKGSPTTICGQPMLGNNYEKSIPTKERTKCPECWAIALPAKKGVLHGNH